MNQIFIVQGRAEMLDDLREDEFIKDSDFDHCWTCPKSVEIGDLMLIYLMTPISAIVGRAVFTSKPFIMDDPSSEWYGKYMAVFEQLKIWRENEFISLKQLRNYYPNWNWTIRPQGAVKVPDNLIQSFLHLSSIQTPRKSDENLKKQNSLFY